MRRRPLYYLLIRILNPQDPFWKIQHVSFKGKIMLNTFKNFLSFEKEGSIVSFVECPKALIQIERIGSQLFNYVQTNKALFLQNQISLHNL